ncbi:MAG TPA: hypothetical protein VFV86_10400 [Nitrososphaeraceae archaeon]|nr:hypothetical protein [Nitrososphaeraceae archaeon]
MFKLYLSIFSIFLLLANLYSVSVFGHNFESDDSITFLTLIEKTQTELELANKNYPANITLSMDHADNAARLVDESFYVDDNVANDIEFTERYNIESSNSNITSKALVVVSLVDEVLRNYADSIDLNFDLTNMSNLLYIIPSKIDSNYKPNLDKLENSYFIDNMNKQKDNKVKTYESSNNLFLDNHNIINYASYETAKSLAMKINTLFQLYLKAFIGMDKTNLKDITKLEDDFYEFYTMIDENSSPAEIMKKVHIDIQPTMQKLYNLKVNWPQAS